MNLGITTAAAADTAARPAGRPRLVVVDDCDNILSWGVGTCRSACRRRRLFVSTFYHTYGTASASLLPPPSRDAQLNFQR